MKIDSTHITSVGTAGWRYVRVCDSGRKIVRIKRVHFGENVRSFRRDNETVRFLRVSLLSGCPYPVERGSSVFENDLGVGLPMISHSF